MQYLTALSQTDTYEVRIANTGAIPIYEVAWHMPIVVHLPYTPRVQSRGLKGSWNACRG
jgi:hypothetical protein